MGGMGLKGYDDLAQEFNMEGQLVTTEIKSQ
jgi:hypothetical protein